MPYTFDIHPEDKLIISHLSGELTPELMIALRKDVISDSRFSPAYSAIDDVTGVSVISITNEQLRQMASVSVLQPGARHALVVANDLQYGLARMYASYAEFSEYEIQVCRSIDEAYDWVIKK